MRGPDGRRVTPAQARLLRRLRADPSWRPKRPKSRRSFDILVERGIVDIAEGEVRVRVESEAGRRSGKVP